ncbi:sphingomyelin phosphodiesterase-like [Sycon ciliatum]|uniref:sphingomyelin phosphodiesterase-like n=1 Tax=Sycon ciliatum TaxID=27933 RepID=UPI0031F703F3
MFAAVRSMEQRQAPAMKRGQLLLSVILSVAFLSVASAKPMKEIGDMMRPANKGEAKTMQKQQGELKKQRTPMSVDSASVHGVEESTAVGSSQSISCDVCKVAIVAVQALVKQNATEEEIVKLSTRICIDLKIEDKRVCDGITVEFREEIIAVLLATALSADEICGLILGDSCADVPDFNSQNWTVPILNNTKPPYTPVKPPAAGTPTARFLYLSDVHYDSKYEVNTLDVCGEPLCCRAYLGPGNAGPYGSYYCDAPLALLQNALEHVAKEEKFDYIIFTGDVPAHNVWNQTRDDITSAITFVCDLFKKYFPGAKIFPAVGNHESSPVNSFPPPSITGKDSHQWLRDSLAENWKEWLPEDSQTTIKEGAFYSALVKAGLRVISLNMNYGDSGNWWLFINGTDPAGQLAWLRDELQKAEIAGEKVQIIGHQPPNGLMKAFSWAYHKIVNRYANTVTAQIFGHAHVDKMSIVFDEDDKSLPVGAYYIGPSLTTNGGGEGLNPAYRIYTQDGDHEDTTHALLDHETYILNISDPHISTNPTWKLEYKASEAYGIATIQPAMWAQALERMQTDVTLTQKFNHYKYHSHLHESCDDKCRKGILCELRTSRSSDHSQCANMTRTEFTQHVLRTAMVDQC